MPLARVTLESGWTVEGSRPGPGLEARWWLHAGMREFRASEDNRASSTQSGWFSSPAAFGGCDTHRRT